ncbi:protein DEFECTIVE IN MERISTEM SILENCING 3 isoform X2 [Lycium barbarum]|uniref:protein DEFECTIVE IN MERISTEM SILENCING 3 isoform X2 n=1 Tax=Lycium barbarum TaxID=112863 RepID=UPI00293E7BDC|nr:protein DEFECTIVE IN MERISTEM SILENCING 3 isoform X2 [Lycium barbarum]
MSINDEKMKESLMFNQGGQSESYPFARDTMQNGTAEAVVYNSKVVNIMQEVCTSCIISSCWKFKSTSHILQKLEDAVHQMGVKIKHHEENIKFLKAQKNGLDNSILDMQVALGNYEAASKSGSENEELSHVQSEEETIEHMLKHGKSAAGIWYQLKSQYGTQASHLPLMKDVLGIVAMLGKVDDDNLSRLLSDYLGLETMLAIVCKTYDGVKALETYDKESHINKTSGLHGLGASIGRPLDGRFLVICLEKLRPYAGEIIADDPQRRLNILKPRLPNGESPPGFLGFAVNMVNIDSVNLYCATSAGYGLRETLFYNLFSRLHVYKTREDMLQALPCIRDGAISLDGGKINHIGVFSGKSEIDVKFPKSSGRSNLPQNYFEIKREMKEMKWKKERTVEDMQREQALLDHARFNFDIKKQEYLKFLAQSSSYATQHSFRQEGSA